MNMLETADRELLSRVISGEDNKSIAADLGISVEGIKSRKHRALREARRYFKDGQN